MLKKILPFYILISSSLAFGYMVNPGLNRSDRIDYQKVYETCTNSTYGLDYCKDMNQFYSDSLNMTKTRYDNFQIGTSPLVLAEASYLATNKRVKFKINDSVELNLKLDPNKKALSFSYSF